MTSVLFVVSEEGYWGEECIDPLEILTNAGVDVTIATPTGDRPRIDERSVDPETVGQETADRIDTVHETDDRIDDARPIASVRATDYDAVFFPGGHGTEWDINQDHHARALLREALENDCPAMAVCHAVGILGFARDSQGAFIVLGRSVTGFPNEWEAEIVDDEERLPDGRKLPYWVEDEVIAAGGEWDAELDEDVSVTVDGNLLTARGPESSRAAAETLLEKLDVEH